MLFIFLGGRKKTKMSKTLKAAEISCQVKNFLYEMCEMKELVTSLVQGHQVT